MGSGAWSASSFSDYSKSKGRTVTRGVASDQGMFTQSHLHPDLDPKNKIRECVDSEEHPETIPVILALDVTGSMGSACKKVAKSLNVIMSKLFNSYKDIEFMVMAIGDFACDDVPLQVSQYESDVRIAEHTDKIFFEGGGGGNGYESYTAAWYFASRHTKIDCLKRGRKGIIITMGDEPLNPYLPKSQIKRVLGDKLEADVETKNLYKEVTKNFDVFHLSVNDKESSYVWQQRAYDVDKSFKKYLGDRYRVTTLDSLPENITRCIDDALEKSERPLSSIVTETIIPNPGVNANGEVTW